MKFKLSHRPFLNKLFLTPLLILVISIFLNLVKCEGPSEELTEAVTNSTSPSSSSIFTKEYLELRCDKNLDNKDYLEYHYQSDHQLEVNLECNKTHKVSVSPINFTEEEDNPDHFLIGKQSIHTNRFCIQSRSLEEDQIVLIVCDLDDSPENRSFRNIPNSNQDHVDTTPNPVKIFPNPTNSPNKRGSLSIQKCCKQNERISISKSSTGNPSYECVPAFYPNGTSWNWNPALFPNFDTDFGQHTHLDQIDKNVNYTIGLPNCTHFNELDNQKDIWFKLLEDGRVFIGLKFWFRPVWLPVEGDNQTLCLDEFATDNYTNSHTTFHKNQVLLYCQIQRFDEYLFHRKLFGTLCVSAACIILILLSIYISIWDRQNLAGWTQFSIFVALFFVFGMEGMRTLIDYNGILVQATTSCFVVAAIAQYFFFALNTTWSVMNFDLFWTFWKLEGSIKGTKGNSGRILCYILFSWVVPLFVILAAFGISHINGDSQSNMEGVFAYAHRRCSSPIREFGFATQGVMFLLNLVFFSCTAFLIWKHRRGITGSRRNSRSEKYTWRSVMLFVKLLIVMGVSSLSIPLDYFFGSEDPLSPFEVIFRTVHFVPVVAILFIFGFNEKNMRLLKQKYPKFGSILGLRLSSFGPTQTNHSASVGQNSIEIK